MSRLESLAQTDLSLSQPLAGIRLIEASAGTGKTFTIAGLYARLVVEEQVEPRKILVMTFTKAACDELRHRLRARLQLCAELAQDAAAAPDGPEPQQDDYERQLVLALLWRTRTATGESGIQLQRRIRDAVNRMDEAVVVTIHGFCQRVLGEFAAQLDGGGPGTTLETSDSDLLEDIAADLWLGIAGENDTGRLAALQQLAASPTALAQLLGGLVYFHGELEPAAAALPPAADEEQARKALFAAWRSNGQDACATFDTWFGDGRLSGSQYKEECPAQLCNLHAVLANGVMPDEGELAKYRLGKLREAVNKKPRELHGEFPALPAFEAIDAWLDASARAEQRQQAVAVQLLHELLAAAREKLDRRKRELARMAYDDQIERLHAGLHGSNGPMLVEALRMQFPYAMVDEFQDTNPRQFEILRRLYEGFGSLLIIGDPKQAIYGFRGGDVHAYLEAAELATSRASLDRNFRSGADLLEAVEALFEQRGEDVFVEPGIRFETVASGRGEGGRLHIGGKAAKPLSLWPMLENANADEQRAAMARAAAVQIADLLDPDHARLDDRPVEAGDIAVLVNTHKEAALVLDALREQHIPAVSVQKTSVFATIEAAEVLRLLDALLAPESLALARGALATLLLGQTLADFVAMQADESRLHEQIEMLGALRRTWLRRGVLAMLEQVIERRAADLLQLADGERRLSNLLQLAELLQEAGHHLSGPRALRDWLARRIRDAEDNREDEQLRLESDARCVQVMTLHASKGLEFELVLMPFMAMRQVKVARKGELARFHRDGKAVKRLITTDSKARSPDDGEALALQRREQLAEDVRLLYVGVTRARQACWMSVEKAGSEPCTKKKKGDSDYPGRVLQWVLGDAPDGSLLAQASPQVACLPMPTERTGTPHRAPEPKLGEARRFERTLRRDWWVHSFSQLSRGELERELDLPADRDDVAAAAVTDVDVVEVVSHPRGPDYGNAVHAILEHADFAAWRDAAELPGVQVGLLEHHLRQVGLSGRELGQAVEATGRLLVGSLNAPFLEAARLVDLPPERRRAEMRFHFGMAGAEPDAVLKLLHDHGYQLQRQRFASLRGQLRGLMHGIIDLICLHEGRWWVIDYKTNHLGDRWADYGPAGMQLAIEQHSYDLQYLIYTVAAHRWLRQMLGDGYDYARDFGGVRYLFLRGMHPDHPDNGVFRDTPAMELIDALDRLLAAPGREIA